MADSGYLGKLPPELRKTIYSHLMIGTEKFAIVRPKDDKEGRVARRYEDRKRNYVGLRAGPVEVFSCTTSLLLANKTTNEEATQILYGSNGFEFAESSALECFLKRIRHSKQYIRCIALIGPLSLRSYGWGAVTRSLKLLAQARTLRSLEVWHLALCGTDGSKHIKRVDVKKLAQSCKPLLMALKDAFDKQELNINILDVVKITLPLCSRDDASHESMTLTFRWPLLSHGGAVGFLPPLTGIGAPALA